MRKKVTKQNNAWIVSFHEEAVADKAEKKNEECLFVCKDIKTRVDYNIPK